MNDIPLELKKEFNLEDSKDEKKIDFEKIIIDNKTIIYSTVLYSCALAIGSVIYRLLQSNSFDKLFQSKNTTVSQLFCENICNYMSLFLITVFLAFCLIGYGIVNIIPYIRLTNRYKHSLLLYEFSNKRRRICNNIDCSFFSTIFNNTYVHYKNKQ